MLSRRTRRVALFVVLACVPAAGVSGCAPLFDQQPAATAQPARSLRAEATSVNLTCKAAVAAVRKAWRLKFLADERYLSLEDAMDAVESGRRELTRIADAGETDKWAAALSAVNESLGKLAAAQLDADVVEAKPAPKPAAKRPSTRPAAKPKASP